ncbi:DUF6573 family protein [Maridesulfovibrio sp.]|uniref:DUF6573 family protein n=1 Tax=Maridesulfovibrio sp. TaxID=2795000 RepID=UPI003B000C66
MVINCDPLFNVIFSYTRKQAIEDGNLIDVTEQAKETGFKVPVAVSLNLYERYITPPKGLEGEGQSVTGRLHDYFLLKPISQNVGYQTIKELVRVQIYQGFFSILL